MPSIVFPTLKWGKRKDKSQMTESFTEDGRLVEPELDVIRTCINEPESGMSFLLDAENQFMGEDGTWRQILWERTCYPVCMVNDGKDSDLGKLLQQISKESRELAIDEQFKKSNKEEKMTPILWIISIVCSTFIIIAGMVALGG